MTTEYVPLADQGPGFYVYRAWGDGDRCIYVGMVGNLGPRDPALRVRDHARIDSWWADVRRIDIAEFADRRETFPEEIRQKAAFNPEHGPNRAGWFQKVLRPEPAVPAWRGTTDVEAILRGDG